MKHECQRCSSTEWTWCDYRGCSACFEGEVEAADRRPDDERAPSGSTGVCANGEHEKCRGKVYRGHVLAGGQRGAKFEPCRCPCHELADAA